MLLSIAIFIYLCDRWFRNYELSRACLAHSPRIKKEYEKAPGNEDKN